MRFNIVVGCILALILFTVYAIFFRPVGPEIYFSYKTEYVNFNKVEVEFYLVNGNPAYSSKPTHFFRINVTPSPEEFQNCNLDEFDWELKRYEDNELLFSTSSLQGTISPEDFFQNKHNGSVFKGTNGPGLGDGDFKVTLSFAKNNNCGIGNENLLIKKIMRVKRKRATAFDVAMSI
jgi:hypothetical protein